MDLKNAKLAWCVVKCSKCSPPRSGLHDATLLHLRKEKKNIFTQKHYQKGLRKSHPSGSTVSPLLPERWQRGVCAAMPSAAALKFANSWGIRRIGHRQPACSLHARLSFC
jgi:hypothetical protein